MLSRALQKANTAVLLDNAQNFEGAVEAYVEACNLLREVMRKSSGEDDKRKLEAIVSFKRLVLVRAFGRTVAPWRNVMQFLLVLRGTASYRY